MTEAHTNKDDNTSAPPAGKGWVARTMRPHSSDGQFDDGDDGYYAAPPTYYGPGPPGYYDQSYYSYPTTPPLEPERRGYYYPPKQQYHANSAPMPPLDHARLQQQHEHEHRSEPEYDPRSREETHHQYDQYHGTWYGHQEPSSPKPSSRPPHMAQIPESHAEHQDAQEVDTEGKEVLDSDINDTDVLSGRGGGTNNHSGNRYFRQLVEQHRAEYVVSKKWQKREIARSIVMSIRSKGGRFLKKESGRWYDIGDQKAREKTSQALREGLAQKMRMALRQSGTMNSAFSPPAASLTGHVHQMHHADSYAMPYKRQRVSYDPPPCERQERV